MAVDETPNYLYYQPDCYTGTFWTGAAILALLKPLFMNMIIFLLTGLVTGAILVVVAVINRKETYQDRYITLAKAIDESPGFVQLSVLHDAIDDFYQTFYSVAPDRVAEMTIDLYKQLGNRETIFRQQAKELLTA